MKAQESSNALRWLPAAGLITAGVLTAARSFALDATPAEDAAMLMRYVAHLAGGHGVAWNVGERPVDGATDLLPLCAAAGLARLGVDPDAAVKLVAFGAHLATALLVFFIAPLRLPGLLAATIVLFGPGLTLANAGFVTPAFGLLAAIAVAAASAPALSTAFGLVTVLLTVTRPEGAFLAASVAVAAVGVGGRKLRLGPVLATVGCLGAYLLWRRWYFGDWVPSPYYTKGGLRLHAYGVLSSINYVGRFLLFAIPPAILAWRGGADARRALLTAAVPVAAFSLLWMLLSAETNFGGRFQYAVLPMAAMAVAGSSGLWWPRRRPARAVCLAILTLAAVVNLVQYIPIDAPDGRREVGLALAPYRMVRQPDGTNTIRTLAVTEAGLVPFYSGWRTIDALGLNDPEIARRRIDAGRLARELPDVLVVHRSIPIDPLPGPAALTERVTHAVVALYQHARSHQYELVREWGVVPGDTHAYFVRSGAPGAAALIAAIRSVAYACRGVERGEVGLSGSTRRLVRVLRGNVEVPPPCLDWSTGRGVRPEP